MGQRLTHAADEVEELQELLQAAMERRNALVVEACDELGWSREQAARHARLSRSRIIAVLSAA